MTPNRPSGYLLSDVTQSTGVGSDRCPWTITARPGQHVRITLYDVQPPSGNAHRHQQQQPTRVVPPRNASAKATDSGVADVNAGGRSSEKSPVDGRCTLYATITETGLGRKDELPGNELVICSGGVAMGGGVAVNGEVPDIGEVGARQTTVYTMTTHRVTVTVYSTPGARFILKYEGTDTERVEFSWRSLL